jgi:Transcriptional regulator
MDNKTKILNVALTFFAKEGFHGTSTAKIAKEAHVSNGALFHHFKTKEELINKLYLMKKEEYKNYMVNNIDNLEPTKKTIKQLYELCTKWHLENKNSVSFFSMFSNSPYIDKLSKEEGSRNFDFLVNLIKSLITNETISNIHHELLVNTFYASVLAIYRFLLVYPENINENITLSFNMWWRSVVNI